MRSHPAAGPALQPIGPALLLPSALYAVAAILATASPAPWAAGLALLLLGAGFALLLTGLFRPARRARPQVAGAVLLLGGRVTAVCAFRFPLRPTTRR